MGAMRATCGYAGLGELRCDNPTMDPLTEAYLSFALGSCMEYDRAQSGTLPTNAMLDFGSYFTEQLIEASFVRTPAAGFCHAGLYTFAWVANVFVWIGLLVLLRRAARFVTASHDKHIWTAADYALMITGLRRRVPADDGESGLGREDGLGLESRLRADLAALGFGPGDVDHIEVGRFCVREMRLHRRKLALNISENEVDPRRQHFKRAKGVDEARKLQEGEVRPRTKEDKAYLKDTAAHGQVRNGRRGHRCVAAQLVIISVPGPPSGLADAPSRGAWWQVWKDLGEVQKQLETERGGPTGQGQLSTGHAFVCLTSEARRDELLRLLAHHDLLDQWIHRLLGRTKWGGRCEASPSQTRGRRAAGSGLGLGRPVGCGWHHGTRHAHSAAMGHGWP